ADRECVPHWRAGDEIRRTQRSQRRCLPARNARTRVHRGPQSRDRVPIVGRARRRVPGPGERAGSLDVEIYGKRVALLKELLPRIARIAGLFNMGNPVIALQWKEVERAARSLGIQPQLLDVRRSEDIPRAFEAAAVERADGLIVALDGLTQRNLRLIAEL